MPVLHIARNPAATRCTGPVGLSRVEETGQFGSGACDVESTQRYKMCDATCEHRSPRCNLIRRNKGPVGRSDTIPIDTAKPPRLPPWKIFQRGPPGQQAEPSHPGPHQKNLHHSGQAPHDLNAAARPVEPAIRCMRETKFQRTHRLRGKPTFR